MATPETPPTTQELIVHADAVVEYARQQLPGQLPDDLLFVLDRLHDTILLLDRAPNIDTQEPTESNLADIKQIATTYAALEIVWQHRESTLPNYGERTEEQKQLSRTIINPTYTMQSAFRSAIVPDIERGDDELFKKDFSRPKYPTGTEFFIHTATNAYVVFSAEILKQDLEIRFRMKDPQSPDADMALSIEQQLLLEAIRQYDASDPDQKRDRWDNLIFMTEGESHGSSIGEINGDGSGAQHKSHVFFRYDPETQLHALDELPHLRAAYLIFGAARQCYIRAIDNNMLRSWTREGGKTHNDLAHNISWAHKLDQFGVGSPYDLGETLLFIAAGRWAAQSLDVTTPALQEFAEDMKTFYNDPLMFEQLLKTGPNFKQWKVWYLRSLYPITDEEYQRGFEDFVASLRSKHPNHVLLESDQALTSWFAGRWAEEKERRVFSQWLEDNEITLDTLDPDVYAQQYRERYDQWQISLESQWENDRLSYGQDMIRRWRGLLEPNSEIPPESQAAQYIRFMLLGITGYLAEEINHSDVLRLHNINHRYREYSQAMWGIAGNPFRALHELYIRDQGQLSSIHNDDDLQQAREQGKNIVTLVEVAIECSRQFVALAQRVGPEQAAIELFSIPEDEGWQQTVHNLPHMWRTLEAHARNLLVILGDPLVKTEKPPESNVSRLN